MSDGEEELRKLLRNARVAAGDLAHELYLARNAAWGLSTSPEFDLAAAEELNELYQGIFQTKLSLRKMQRRLDEK